MGEDKGRRAVPSGTTVVTGSFAERPGPPQPAHNDRPPAGAVNPVMPAAQPSAAALAQPRPNRAWVPPPGIVAHPPFGAERTLQRQARPGSLLPPPTRYGPRPADTAAQPKAQAPGQARPHGPLRCSAPPCASPAGRIWQQPAVIQRMQSTSRFSEASKELLGKIPTKLPWTETEIWNLLLQHPKFGELANDEDNQRLFIKQVIFPSLATYYSDKPSISDKFSSIFSKKKTSDIDVLRNEFMNFIKNKYRIPYDTQEFCCRDIAATFANLMRKKHDIILEDVRETRADRILLVSCPAPFDRSQTVSEVRGMAGKALPVVCFTGHVALLYRPSLHEQLAVDPTCGYLGPIDQWMNVMIAVKLQSKVADSDAFSCTLTNEYRSEAYFSNLFGASTLLTYIKNDIRYVEPLL